MTKWVIPFSFPSATALPHQGWHRGHLVSGSLSLLGSGARAQASDTPAPEWATAWVVIRDSSRAFDEAAGAMSWALFEVPACVIRISNSLEPKQHLQ